MKNFIVCPGFVELACRDKLIYLNVLLKFPQENPLRICLDKSDKVISSYKSIGAGSNGKAINDWLNYMNLSPRFIKYVSVAGPSETHFRNVIIDIYNAQRKNAHILVSENDEYLDLLGEQNCEFLVEPEESISLIRKILFWEEAKEKLPKNSGLRHKDGKVNLKQFVLDLCENFGHAIEYLGGWKFLFKDQVKKEVHHENVPQNLFKFSIHHLCKLNNVDLSPETNLGSGALDFKFSIGHSLKVNLEMKYAKHPKLLDGFSKQLQKYNEAECTNESVLLVILTQDCDRKKVDKLFKLKNTKEREGLQAPEIVVINGLIKTSASLL